MTLRWSHQSRRESVASPPNHFARIELPKTFLFGSSNLLRKVLQERTGPHSDHWSALNVSRWQSSALRSSNHSERGRFPLQTCKSNCKLAIPAAIISRDLLSSEAQQRCFSYRSIPVAIVSQNHLVLVFFIVCARVCVCVCVQGGGGYRTTIVRYVAKWGIAQMCLCETKYLVGVIRTILGSC